MENQGHRKSQVYNIRRRLASAEREPLLDGLGVSRGRIYYAFCSMSSLRLVVD